MIWLPICFIYFVYLFVLSFVFILDLGFDFIFYLSHDILYINMALLIPCTPFLSPSSRLSLNLNHALTVNYSKNYNSEISNPKLNKDLYKIIGGGFMSYKNVDTLGNLNELLDNYPLLNKNIENYLANLEDNKTYTLLPVVR